MSVNTSISIGVGFTIPEDAFEFYRKSIPDEENYGNQELLEELPLRSLGLSFGTGGSYYDSSEPLVHWICVSRLTTTHDTDDIHGGVVGLSKATITLQERENLNKIAKFFGLTDPVVGQFLSVLWH